MSLYIEPFISSAAWNTMETKDWDGFKVGEAWHTDTPLVDYIRTPWDKGKLTTIHPDIPAPNDPDGPLVWSSNGTFYPPNNSNLDFFVTTALSNRLKNGSLTDGFQMTLGFAFDRSRGDSSPFAAGDWGYVQAQNYTAGNLDVKLSFVANSGVKFAGLEAAIIDVDAMNAIADEGLTVQDFLADGTVADNDFDSQHYTQLMLGVEYNAGDAKVDSGYVSDLTPAPSNTSAEYYAGFLSTVPGKSQEPRFDDTDVDGRMKVLVEKDLQQNEFRIRIWIKPTPSSSYILTYDEPSISASGFDMSDLRLQSHSGSGVIFDDIDITPPPGN